MYKKNKLYYYIISGKGGEQIQMMDEQPLTNTGEHI